MEFHPQKGIVAQKGAHGTKHRTYLSPMDILQRLAGTVDGSAIRAYVGQVVGTA